MKQRSDKLQLTNDAARAGRTALVGERFGTLALLCRSVAPCAAGAEPATAATSVVIVGHAGPAVAVKRKTSSVVAEAAPRRKMTAGERPFLELAMPEQID